MSGFTCSRWQREPSGPQTESTLSQEKHLRSEPRSPGPPRVPQVALAIDGRAITRAAVRARTLVIVHQSLVVDVARLLLPDSGEPCIRLLCRAVFLRQTFVLHLQRRCTR